MIHRFVVRGKPQTAGSKRAFPIPRTDGSIGVAVSDANPKSRDWKRAVADVVRREFGDRPPLEGPLQLTIVFIAPRPKTHLRSTGAVKVGAPYWVTTRPDLLKLTRAIEDALTGVLWRDDSQIAVEHLSKYYDLDGPKMILEVETIGT